MTGQSILSADVDHSSSVTALMADPIFGKAPYLGLARLLPYTREKLLAPGEYLYRNGASATDMFFLLEGQVKLMSKNGQELVPASQRMGEEAGTDFSTYLSDAVALTAVRVLVIPKNSVSTLFAGVPKLKAEFYFSLMQIFAGEHLHVTTPAKPAAPMAVIDKAPESIVNVLGWLLTLLVAGRHFAVQWQLGAGQEHHLLSRDCFIDGGDVGVLLGR